MPQAPAFRDGPGVEDGVEPGGQNSGEVGVGFAKLLGAREVSGAFDDGAMVFADLVGVGVAVCNGVGEGDVVLEHGS